MRLASMVLGLGVALVALAPPVAFAEDATLAAQLDRVSAMSSKEMVDEAAKAAASVEAAAKSLERLAAGKGAGDSACLRRSGPSIEALSQVAAQAKAGLAQAIDDGVRERSQHEMRKLVIAQAKAGDIVEEAERCIKGAGAQDGVTRVRVEDEPESGDDATDPVLIDPLAIGFDPPRASPF